MNKYPAWLNILVLIIMFAGCLLALPNIYGSLPAIQIADNNGVAYDEARLQEYVGVVESAGLTPEAAYLKDGRVVLRFEEETELTDVSAELKRRYNREASVAQTLAPRSPKWVRDLGLNPMSLGLDLRGGVYVLLEVDMNTAIDTRMMLYEQGITDNLLDARIRHLVVLEDRTINVRLTKPEDLEAARLIIQRSDADLLISDGADENSLRVRMSEAQIKARQDFAIEQNIIDPDTARAACDRPQDLDRALRGIS